MTPPAYPPAVAELLALPAEMPLGPGTPAREVEARLRRLAVPDARDPAAARACLAGLWLRFNFLAESHAVSQELDTPEGAAWHAVMHRREPDGGNSKYWWRRAGPLPPLDELAAGAAADGYAYTTAAAFVDFCDRVRGTGTPGEAAAVRVQAREWAVLFDWCFRRATGANN